MNKKPYLLIALLFSFSLLFIACDDDDDDNGVNEEWKAYNEKLFKEVENNKEYFPLESGTKNGTLRYKYTDVITSTMKSTKITQLGYPYVSDSVVVRFIGWRYLLDGTKHIFDSTEDDANKQNGVGFRLNATTNGYINVIPGWIDMLTNMRVGEEVEVCIPYQLGYGSSGGYAIPAYTTLWFDIKLLKIIPDNSNEWN